MSEIDEVTEYDSLEEALAAAMSDADPGCVVIVHEADCKHDGEDDETCACVPTAMIAGNPLALIAGARA